MQIRWSRILVIFLVVIAAGNVTYFFKKSQTQPEAPTISNQVPVDDSTLDQSLRNALPSTNKRWSPEEIQQVADLFATITSNNLPKHNTSVFRHLIALDMDIFTEAPSAEERLALLGVYSPPIGDIYYVYEDAFVKGHSLHQEIAALSILTSRLAIETIKTVSAYLISIPKDDPELAKKTALIDQMKKDLAPTITKSVLLLSNGKYKFESDIRVNMAVFLDSNLSTVWRSLPISEKKRITGILNVTYIAEDDPKVKPMLTQILTNLSKL